jgi:hypothetical protein
MYLARYSPFTASADSLSVLREWKAAAFGRLLQTRSRAMQSKPGCASDQASEEQKVSFERRGGREKVCGSRPYATEETWLGGATVHHWQQW